MNSRINNLFNDIVNENLIDTRSEFEQILSEKLNIAIEEEKKKRYLKGAHHKNDDDDDNLDPVNKKALKGKHKDRKDKDLDNDGDVDDSDKFLHKKRKAITKKMKKEAHDRWQK